MYCMSGGSTTIPPFHSTSYCGWRHVSSRMRRTVLMGKQIGEQCQGHEASECKREEWSGDMALKWGRWGAET